MRDTNISNIGVIIYIEDYKQYVRLDDGVNEKVYQISNETDLAVLVSRFIVQSYQENINLIYSKQYVMKDEEYL